MSAFCEHNNNSSNNSNSINNNSNSWLDNLDNESKVHALTSQQPRFESNFANVRFSEFDLKRGQICITIQRDQIGLT